MIRKIDSRDKLGNEQIRILFPGMALGQSDTGIATIGRIDHARLPAGTTIPMHPHINDEILSYFRSGIVKHTDSAGFVEYITASKLMLMKAGKAFYHEESIQQSRDTFEGLQIFIRPGKPNMEPEVQFHELSTVHDEHDWRLLAAPTEAPLQLSSQTWIYDTRMTQGKDRKLPDYGKSHLALLYILSLIHI